MDLCDIVLPDPSLPKAQGQGELRSRWVPPRPELLPQAAHHAAQVVRSIRRQVRVDFAGYWSLPNPEAPSPRLICLSVALPGEADVHTEIACTSAYDIRVHLVRDLLATVFEGRDLAWSDLCKKTDPRVDFEALHWVLQIGLKGVYVRPIAPNGQLVGMIAAGMAGSRLAVTAQMVVQMRRLGNGVALDMARLASRSQMPFQDSAF